jgi:hypothetical protein
VIEDPLIVRESFGSVEAAGELAATRSEMVAKRDEKRTPFSR